MLDAFETLLPFKWRDQEYPVSDVVVSLAHDLVEHKYWGVDGARVEATGVAPLRISASIPLLNQIKPGVNERWKEGDLYPTALRQLFVDFGNKAVGHLQHPEFGRIACKPERLECRLAGDRRGHAQVEATWVQTNDDTVKTIPQPRPAGQMQAAAAELDDDSIRDVAPEIPKYEESFEDFANGLSAIGDQVSILQQRTAGKIGALVYRTEQVVQSAERARSPMTWPATHAAERIKEAANALREQLSASDKSLGLFTVRETTTLAGLTTQMPATTGVGDIIKLNPRLVAAPTIPAGTVVRYYRAA